MKKLSGVLIVAMLLLGMVGARPAAAAAERRFASLLPQAVILDYRAPFGLTVATVGARLVEETDPKAPDLEPGLPGRTITFSAGATPLCTAVTGADGWARCTPSLANALTVLLGGYTATFAGDAGYLPVSATGLTWLALPNFFLGPSTLPRLPGQ